MTQASSPAASTTSSAPTHSCLRCGVPVTVEVALCDTCNPLGLAQPASSQVHAIAAGGIVVFVVFLAVIASLAIAGTGPFGAHVEGATPDGVGLRVSFSVTNEGPRASETTCIVFDPARRDAGPQVQIRTPRIPPGGTVVMNRTIVQFGGTPIDLDVSCVGP